jgi:hypothetical protein
MSDRSQIMAAKDIQRTSEFSTLFNCAVSSAVAGAGAGPGAGACAGVRAGAEGSIALGSRSDSVGDCVESAGSGGRGACSVSFAEAGSAMGAAIG